MPNTPKLPPLGLEQLRARIEDRYDETPTDEWDQGFNAGIRAALAEVQAASAPATAPILPDEPLWDHKGNVRHDAVDRLGERQRAAAAPATAGTVVPADKTRAAVRSALDAAMRSDWRTTIATLDTLDDYLALAAAPAPRQEPATGVPGGWRFKRNTDGSVGIFAPPPRPGESQRTSAAVYASAGDRDLHELLGKLADHQAAAPAARQDESETPGVLGAIVNGRVYADRLEQYPFESEGGNLRLCSDWIEFRRCFEWLAEHAAQPARQDESALPCGHPASMLLRSAETGEPLYCEACDDKSGRRDAEQREAELSEQLRQDESSETAARRLRNIADGVRLYGAPDKELLASRIEAVAATIASSETAAEPLYLVMAGGDGFQAQIVPESKLDDAYLLTQWVSLDGIDPEEREATLAHFHDDDSWTHTEVTGRGDRLKFSTAFEDGWVEVIRVPRSALVPTTPAPSADVVRDAERYRWLRDGVRQRQGQELSNRGGRSIDKSGLQSLMRFDYWCSPSELDAAIDAALAAPGKDTL